MFYNCEIIENIKSYLSVGTLYQAGILSIGLQKLNFYGFDFEDDDKIIDDGFSSEEEIEH